MKKQTKINKESKKEKKLDNTDLALLQLLAFFSGAINALLTADKPEEKLKNNK